MAEFYPQVRQTPPGTRYRGWDGARQSGAGVLITPGVNTSYSPQYDLTLSYAPSDVDDFIPYGTTPYLWQGSVAASDAAAIDSYDIVHSPLRLFTVKGTGKLYVAPIGQWLAISGANDVARMEYFPQAGWRLGQPRVANCVPWLVGDGIDPYVDEVYGAPVGMIHFGPDGRLYATRAIGTNGLGIYTIDPVTHAATLFLDLSATGLFSFAWAIGSEINAGPVYLDFVITITKVYYSTGRNARSCNLDGSGDVVIAGTSSAGYNGDGTATACKLNGAGALALAPDGLSLLICDVLNGMVRRLTFASGQLTTVAGGIDGFGGVAFHPLSPSDTTTSNAGDGGLATVLGAYIPGPTCVQQVANGDIYVAAGTLQVIRKIDHATGFLSTVYGGGASIVVTTGGDETVTTDVGFGCDEPGAMRDYTSFLIDPSGVFWRYKCGRIYRNDVAVTGLSFVHPIYRASGFPIPNALSPSCMAMDPAGIFYIASGGIERFICPPSITCVPTLPRMMILAGAIASGDAVGDDSTVRFNGLGKMQVNPLDGALFVLDVGNGKIKRRDAITGVWTAFAAVSGLTAYRAGGGGGGTPGSGLAFAANGDLYFSRTVGGSISHPLAVIPNGTTTPVPIVTTGVSLAFYGNSNGGIAVSHDQSTLLISVPTFFGSFNVLGLDLSSGVVSVYAGTGAFALPRNTSFGQYNDPTMNASRLTALMPSPSDVYVDSLGNVYVLSGDLGGLSRINLDGSVSRLTGSSSYVVGGGDLPTFGDTGSNYFGDGLPTTNQYTGSGGAPAGSFVNPLSFCISDCFDQVIADIDDNVVRVLSNDGNIYTLAGGPRINHLASYPTSGVSPTTGTGLPTTSPILAVGEVVNANAYGLPGKPLAVCARPRAQGAGVYVALTGSAHCIVLVA